MEGTTAARRDRARGQRVKITAVEPSGNLYGSEYCLLDVITGTRSRGLKWDVVLPGGGGFDALLEKNKISRRTLLRRNSHELPLFRKLPGYLRLRQHIVSRRSDVVYLNQAGMLRAMNLILKGLHTPLVCQVQTLEDAQFVAAHPSEHAGVTTFICNSRFIASAAGIDPKKVSVFYQPVVGAPQQPAPPPPEQRDMWRVGIVGRIAASKGHWVFLEAAKQLVGGGMTDVQFVVVGEGIDARTTREFSEAVKASGVSAHFDLRGYRADIASELARLHAVVIPSLAEPLGRVLLDACVARRPVVVTSSGGLGEFSERFSLGVRVPPDDAAALAGGIRQLVRNYDSELAAFEAAAAATLARLDPKSYVDAMSLLLAKATQFRPSAVEWMGTGAA
jgi:glycosyltransferase involved in cell wall biosynthesis